MKSISLFLVAVILVNCTWAQKQACEALDDGPFLATLPQLVFNVKEVTTEDLRNAPIHQRDWYRSELRLGGNYAAGDFKIQINKEDFSFLNPFDYFEVVTEDSKNYLKLKTGIDRDGPTPSLDDDTSIILFKITCVPDSSLSLPSIVYDALIWIEDINDNKPVFSNINGPLHIDISESMPLDVTLIRIKATDLDLNADQNLTFSLNTHEDKFHIDSMTGDLMLRSPLDYDTMGMTKHLDVVVQVEDIGATTHKSTGIVRINVQDADDLPPVYEYPGCWRHVSRCSWPKYTTGLKLTKGKPITLQPVPNKGQGPVDIKARDLDSSMSKINFIIASTIPPGSEDKFRLDTSKTTDGSYHTKIVPLETMTVNEGFEIFLKAEEDTAAKRFVMSMIYFTGGSSSGTDNHSSGQTGDNVDDDDDDEYSGREVALIVIVAILFTVVFALAIGLFLTCRKRGDGSVKTNGLAMNTNTQM